MDILIKKAQKKDPDAFVELMEGHMQAMYKTARAYLKNDEDAADAIQDTILSCFEHIQDLKRGKYFKTWMTRILINKCNDIMQKNNKIQLSKELPVVPVWDEKFNQLEWYEFLQGLDEKYRTILLLYYLEDFNTREIAEILDMNEKTVQTRLSRGRNIVSQQYCSQGGRIYEKTGNRFQESYTK